MELCLLGILMELFALKKAYGAAHQERIIRASGEEVLLPCGEDSPYARWFWFPLTSRCADISGESVEITWGPTKYNVTPIRFHQRLVYQSSGSLLLRNLVMSDEGSYVCRLPNGSETRTVLEVTTGCHNYLTVSSQWLNPSSLQLSCRPCQSVKAADGFYWVLNSERLGRRRWAQKSHSGSYVTLNPIRPVVWGRWECHSIANPTWVSEICLKPHTMEDPGSFPVLHEDLSRLTLPPLAALWCFPPSTPWTPAAAPGEPDAKGTEVWIWATVLAGLYLVAVLGLAVCFWKRVLAGRKNKRRKEEIDHPSLRNPAGVHLQQNEELPERESLEETTASLHYVQLQLPPGKSPAIRNPDSTTVYTAIV